MLRRIKIRHDQIGFQFKDGKFQKALEAGRHWIFDPFLKLEIQITSLDIPIFTSDRLNQVVKQGALKGLAEILDLRDWQRALVWIDGRFREILKPGLYALWNQRHDVRVEIIDAREIQFVHDEFPAITRCASAIAHLQIVTVERDQQGVLFVDGKFVKTIQPGRYAFWRNIADVGIAPVDLREQALDVSGQDLMTSDKVTLRINAMVTFKVADARLALSCSDSPEQSLYRATQLALRSIVGQHELDAFLVDKEQIAGLAFQQLRDRAAELGLQIIALGVRDVILPGDMKLLMNRVIEAKKAAEANLIARREETAAIRSQANTAKLLDAHPTLMRLRELEVLEKVAGSSNLKVVLDDNGGLSDRLSRLV